MMIRIIWLLGLILLLFQPQMNSQIVIGLPFMQVTPAGSRVEDENDSTLYLIEAADRGDLDSLIKLVVEGYDINQTTGDGVTALMYAASNGHFEVTEVLIGRGAEINAIPYNGLTALSGACINNHYDIVLLLLQHGADAEIADNQGITPLLYAVASDYFNITELLLMFGADPDNTDLEGATALHAAALYARPDIAWLLADYGASLNHQDNFGFTPLMMAVQLGRADMAEYLMEIGADINIRTNDGMSALAIAVANNKPALAEKLIEIGANPREKISYTDNLMNLARWQGDDELISLMKKHGVKSNILPGFGTLRISGNVLLNTGDFYNGLQAALEDHKYGLLLTAGWYTRPVRRRVLVHYSENWYDQLWEQRHLFFGGLHMEFPVKNYFSLNERGFYAGINMMYSKGRYWGTYSYPEPGWHISPSAGYYKAGSWWFYSIGYQYLQMNITDKPAHRITLGAGIRFPVKKDPLIYRTIYW